MFRIPERDDTILNRVCLNFTSLRVPVSLGSEESVTQVSWQSELLGVCWHSNLWGPVFPRHQETPAGVLHLWYVTSRPVLLCLLTCFVASCEKLSLSSSVPRYLLEDVGRGSTDPFMISDYTHGESEAEAPPGFVAECGRVWQVSEPRPPLACRWMVHWPHLQASKRVLNQLSGDHWKTIGYVHWCLGTSGRGCMSISSSDCRSHLKFCPDVFKPLVLSIFRTSWLIMSSCQMKPTDLLFPSFHTNWK